MSAIQNSEVGFPVGGRETLLDSVAKRMIQLLMDSHYKAGEQLPSEHELASQFHVGRGTIREAIKALAIVGFLRAERGRGTFVADRSGFLVGPIALGFDSSLPLDSLIDARKLIEVQTARLAAKRSNRSSVRVMEEHLALMRQGAQSGNSEEYLRGDVAFHFAIADAAQNPVLTQFLTLIRNLMRQWITHVRGMSGVADEAVEQHRKILDAIAAGNERLAGEAMELHLEAMGKRLALAKKKLVVEEGVGSFRNAEKADRTQAPLSSDGRQRQAGQKSGQLRKARQ
jgi:GntR family transcriptional repressor for pyruvate dehydrogenase complex